MRHLIWLIPVAWCAACNPPRESVDSPAVGAKVVRPGLVNVYRITEILYCGAAPEGDAGFQSLKDLGVKTVITVDGTTPDVESAHRHGLRYVHLPIGYDGVPQEQALKIAKAVRDLPGPVYLHCHHGQHRGPAAAAVAHLFLDQACTPDVAVAEMRRAGTDLRFEGLYASPRRLRRPKPGELDGMTPDFPEIAPVAGLAHAMVAIDGCCDNLKLIQKAGWKTPDGHADLTPAHEALQLMEHFREAARLPDVGDRSEELRRWLGEAEASATALEAALRGGQHTDIDALFRRCGNACSRCHAKYRDRPIP